MLPEYLVGYNFIIKEKRGEGENHLPCSSSISSLTPPICQVGEILTPYGSSGPVMHYGKFISGLNLMRVFHFEVPRFPLNYCAESMS